MILNYDNMRVRSLAKKIRTKVEYFGKAKKQGIFQIEKIEKGQKFWLKYENKTQDFFTPRFGEHNVYATAASKVFEHILKKRLLKKLIF